MHPRDPAQNPPPDGPPAARRGVPEPLRSLAGILGPRARIRFSKRGVPHVVASHGRGPALASVAWMSGIRQLRVFWPWPSHGEQTRRDFFDVAAVVAFLREEPPRVVAGEPPEPKTVLVAGVDPGFGPDRTVVLEHDTRSGRMREIPSVGVELSGVDVVTRPDGVRELHAGRFTSASLNSRPGPAGGRIGAEQADAIDHLRAAQDALTLAEEHARGGARPVVEEVARVVSAALSTLLPARQARVTIAGARAQLSALEVAYAILGRAAAFSPGQDFDRHLERAQVALLYAIDQLRDALPPAERPRCSVCGATQYATPAGITCDNGHGGAPAADAEANVASTRTE
jgi:hypothetical protein